MRRQNVLATAIALTLSFAFLGTAWAIPKKGVLAKKIELFRNQVLTDKLGLDEETGKKLFPLLARYARTAREVRREEKRLRDQLFTESAKVKPDEAKLEELMDALIEKEIEFRSLRIESFQATKGILTAQQRVKLLVVLPKLDKEIRKKIKEARGP